MQSFSHPIQTIPGPTSIPSPAPIPPQTTELERPPSLEDGSNNEDIFVGYLSDDESTDEESDSKDVDTRAIAHTGHGPHGSGTVGTELAPAVPAVEPASESLPVDFNVRLGPQRKRRKLDVPARVLRHRVKEERRQGQKKALDDIEKLICSKRKIFDTGHVGLQAYHARAIQSYLQMVLHNGRKSIEASERAAESQGFAARWGGRLVCHWAKEWIKNRELPVSRKGRHMKAYTLLSDPAICAELRSYVRSNKWAMNPAKLAEFSKDNLVSVAAKEYLQHIINKEMPEGLKKYMEIELFPHIHLEVRKGISLHTAQ